MVKTFGLGVSFFPAAVSADLETRLLSCNPFGPWSSVDVIARLPFEASVALSFSDFSWFCFGYGTYADGVTC